MSGDNKEGGQPELEEPELLMMLDGDGDVALVITGVLGGETISVGLAVDADVATEIASKLLDLAMESRSAQRVPSGILN